MGGTGKGVVIRGRHAGGRRLPRTTATLNAALGLLVMAELATAAAVQQYTVVLVGAVVVGTVAAAWRMWSGSSYYVRLATGGLAGVILAGQVLVSSLGGPGGPVARWHLSGVAVAALAVVVLLLAATAPPAPDTRRHPYAL